ncbi:hypothetical protein MGYG_06200 [Nannizzia gypsea CBS 118893]|uniref:Uncharacterized protein n=1 Tax=Arthroderma gypseum (strain ATCC MYA-4604 / CBS 118893) TaxID=535722 RepID=E4UYM1_ARTGP|nr:hypothetical protein MGYG_06200 [Nannizzia gypsea CBS 118893]EFR03201.1 hypothetical protein MGYG_06200 [Nannizzia gypsea CBS 118893]
MDYLSSICRNFTAFVTLQTIPRRNQKINCDEIPKHSLAHTMLSPPSSCRLRSSRKPPKGEASENEGLMPLTPETPSAGRKRKIVETEEFSQNDDEGNDSDTDGSTLIEVERSSKRLRLFQRPPRPSFQRSICTSSSYDSEHDGSTLIKDEQFSRAKESNINREDLLTSPSDTSSGSEDDESLVSLEDGERVFNRMAMAKDTNASVPIVQTPPSRQHRRRNQPRYSCSVGEAYRPSPKIVDKNLSKQIVRRDARGSDLSEEEIYGSKYSTKKEIKRDLNIEFCMEKAKRWATAVERPSGNWSDAEKDMYFRLAMRGFEPVLPHGWKMDFMTLPETLFTLPNDDTAYISSRNAFRGMKYFSNLISLGGRVRDRITCHLRPEKTIKQYLYSYLQWTLRDVDMYSRPQFIPPYSVYTLKPKQTARDAVNIMNSKLIAMAKCYQNAWRLAPSIESDDGTDKNVGAGPQYQDRTFPVITGYLICGSVVALMTLDSDPRIHPTFDTKTSGRLISRFDFSEYGQDVWNALAIAIAAARIRKTIAQCEQEGIGDMMWMSAPVFDPPDEDL